MDYAIGIGIGAIAAAIYTYYQVVPPDNIHITGLSESKVTSTVYREDFWPEHGYADLPHGRTHYYLLGPKDGDKIVFVHGILPTPPACHTFLNSLAAKGYRILCYELYGRGYSDAPGTVYDDGLFISQLSSLLMWIQWGKTDIIGYSMGGAIACGFTTMFPDQVGRVAFIAPAGLVKKLPFTAKILGMPIIGKLMIHTIGPSMVAKGSAKNHFIHNENTNHFNQIQRYQLMNHKGIMRAFRSTVINFNFGDYEMRYQLLEKSHHDKIIAIWGEHDKVVPTHLSGHLQELVPSLKLYLRPNTSHSIVMEDPDYLVETIDRFLHKD